LTNAHVCDFNQQIALIEKTVALRTSNTFTVELRSDPGSGISLQFIGIDNTPPTIIATLDKTANAAGWNNTNVIVTFTCSDTTSGIATCPAPVNMTTEGANQIVSGTAADRAGNTANASVAFMPS
jgi:hypothetical protein